MSNYDETVERRRAFRLNGYKSVADVGFDGQWVSPYQITSNSMSGPVFVALHWLDEPSIQVHRSTLSELGYLPTLRFNKVVDLALAQRKLSRSDIYVTQAFHLVPQQRSQRIPPEALRASFEAVTRHELNGRSVIALGNEAAKACAAFGIPHANAPHPSRRGYSNIANASAIANALVEIGC
jgi:hypothetical protein